MKKVGILVVFLAAPIVFAQSQQQLAHEIFKELIEINTTDSVGNVTTAAEAMAKRLRQAGFPDDDVQVLGPDPRKHNLVARIHGTGARKPILLLAHLDVVEAKREDWSFDPFKFLEKDGFFYGRGTSDDKAMASIWMANFIRYRKEGYRPDRDLIVALTADEEGGDYNGVDWLVKNHRELIDADFCFNEGGNGQLKNGMRLLNAVQASEKVYQSFDLLVTNPGGHSSRPVKDNAIYHLAAGLNRLSQFDFPVHLSDVTRSFFDRMSTIEKNETAAAMKRIARNEHDASAAAMLEKSPYYNALMRTTCVATRLDAGHADNALPQRAMAVVNCRVLPEESVDGIQQKLIEVLADSKIQVSRKTDPTPSPPSPLRRDVMAAIEATTQQLWPGTPVAPIMGTGATDAVYLRNGGIPTYGVSGLFQDIDDVREHGKDERLLVHSYDEGIEFLYRLVKRLSQ